MLHERALGICLKELPTDPARFYGPAAGLPLGAGLILRDCPVAHPDINKLRYETGLSVALVLTHECDVDQSNERVFNDLILVCPIIPLFDFCEEYESELGVGSWGGLLPHLARGDVFRAMYIPPPRPELSCPELEGGGILYFNHISACRVSWLNDLPSKMICSLSERGLRMLDLKLKTHLFREKPTALSFGR